MATETIDQRLQQLDAKIAQGKQTLSETVATQTPESWWSTTNAMTMSSVILAFGVVVLVLATFLIRGGKSAESVLATFGTILIIVVAVFLVVAGYSDKQIAPVMGLLGTIAGYLLGKGSNSK